MNALLAKKKNEEKKKRGKKYSKVNCSFGLYSELFAQDECRLSIKIELKFHLEHNAKKLCKQVPRQST